jgi:hypothetical protein
MALRITGPTVDKVLFGVNVTYNCSTVDNKVLLLPIH